MKKQFYLFFSLLLLLSSSSFSQVPKILHDDFQVYLTRENTFAPGTLTPATPRNGFDPVLAESLQETLDLLQEALNAVGLSAAVDLGGDNVWAGTSGNSSQTDTLTADYLFGIGSVSKTLTASCILLMYEDSLLKLDDPISDYLPTYPFVDPEITIRQLLNHTSGLYNYTNHPNFPDSINSSFLRIWEPEEVLQDFMDVPYFPRGTDWTYSNTNYLLLGLIIENISQHDFATEVRNRLLTPLQLNSVLYFPDEPLQQAELAHVWLDFNGSGTLTDISSFGLPLNSLFSAAGAAGAFLSTPTDMAKWMRLLTTGAVLQPATMAEMRDIIPLSTNGDSGYGLGLIYGQTSCVGGVWGHAGDIIYSSDVYYSPGADISIAVHSNDGSLNSGVLADVIDDLFCTYAEYLSVGTDEAQNDFASSFKIFPNPASDQLLVEYQINSTSDVALRIFNSNGQLIQNIFQEKQAAGDHQFSWGNPELSGLYFLQIQIGDRMFTEKVVFQ